MRQRAAVNQAFQYGLIIFVLTVLLGRANATQLFGALDRATLLTHLHSGTLGWITMGVIGIAIWIFAREGVDLLAPVMLSALSTAAYVMAFWSGVFILRGVFGTSLTGIISVGTAGIILHGDGTQWTRYGSGPTVGLRSVWAAARTCTRRSRPRCATRSGRSSSRTRCSRSRRRSPASAWGRPRGCAGR